MSKVNNNPEMIGCIPFTKGGINGKTFEKWTEPVIHEMLDELEEWLLEEEPILNNKGEVIAYRDKGNIFFKDFLHKKRLFADWITYVEKKFESVSKRIKYIREVTEQRLVSLGVNNKTNPAMTKFILSANYGYTEKTESKNENTNTTSITWKEEKNYSGGESII